MLKISIECEPHTLDEHMKALGYHPSAQKIALSWRYAGSKEAELAKYGIAVGEDGGPVSADPNSAAAYTGPVSHNDENDVDLDEAAHTADDGVDQAAVAAEVVEAGNNPALPPGELPPKRERGKPSAGRARRTKDEIAEDEAADKRDAEQKAKYEAGVKEQMQTEAAAPAALQASDLNAAVKKLMDKVGPAKAPAALRELLGRPLAQIPDTQEALRTAIGGIDAYIAGEKVGPLFPVNGAAPQVAPEPEPPLSETTLPAEPWADLVGKVTREDLTAAMRAYHAKHTPYFAIDGRNIFKAALGAPPETPLGSDGKPTWKDKTVPEDLIPRAVFYWREAIKPENQQAIASQRP